MSECVSRLIGASKESAVWQSSLLEGGCIDVLPDDVNLPYDREDFTTDTRIFMIAVSCSCPSTGMEYDLVVSSYDPIPITNISALREGGEGDHASDWSLLSGEYRFHCVSTTIHRDEEIVLLCSVDLTLLSSPRGAIDSASSVVDKYGVSVQHGRGVYTADTLGIYGPRRASRSLDLDTAINEAKRQEAGPSAVLPVVYLSTTCKYPTAHNYMWRVCERVLKLCILYCLRASDRPRAGTALRR
jgi:hypothetical protein